MHVFRLSLLVVVVVVLGFARFEGSHAAPLPQAAGGIPPFVWSLTYFPGAGEIAEPGRYTVQFLADGTVGIGADCNRSAGVWSAGDGTIDITANISTLALCPEDSLGEPFVQALNAATGYTLSGGALTLHGPAGDMTFTT